MEFFTKVEQIKTNIKIDYTKNLFFVGSCFAQNISQKFSDIKFNTLTNPFGTIYNPLSINSMLKNIANQKYYSISDIFCDTEHGNIWHSFDAHSSLSAYSSQECINNLNSAVIKANEFLKKANVVFVTLGSAYVFFLNSTQNVVANCHKQNANEFSRKLVSVENCTRAIIEIVQTLKSLNKNIKVVFTISPLRYISYGMHCNNLSKATLLLSLNEALCKLNNAEYFPSYEIILDELRDYRFYDNDMIHLSKIAIDIIFEKLALTYFEKRTLEHIKLVSKFIKNVEHKIENNSSQKTIDFARANLEQANLLESQINGLNLKAEKEYFCKFLKS